MGTALPRVPTQLHHSIPRRTSLFDRMHKTSYLPLTEIMHLPCTIFDTASYSSKVADLHLVPPFGEKSFEFHHFWR